MSAYLVVDVDDLLQRFYLPNRSLNLQELAGGLRGAAALASGLISVDKLNSIAVANWGMHKGELAVDVELVFRTAGYQIFDIVDRENLADRLMTEYFDNDPEFVSELILVTTRPDMLPLIRLIQSDRSTRVRMWGSEDILQNTEHADDVIFQPLETLLGIQTKNVSVYIDFENIAISLNEQGYIVNLDHLIEQLVARAKSYGHVVKMNAYAPWGMRGTLPPLVDVTGREIAEDAPSRLMLANIDPVFNLPGKNSADIRIARDVMTEASQRGSSDLYIIASGDRDFNEVLNALLQQNKSVVIWGVHGSTSRQLEQNPGIIVEYIDDFTNLQTHQSLSTLSVQDDPEQSFIPSQWSSVVIQFDRLINRLGSEFLTAHLLIEQLIEVGAVASEQRGQELVAQAIAMGILNENPHAVVLNPMHSVVEKTRLIRDTIARRVANTLAVRNWEYVNYGFLLKGLEMEQELLRPGMNIDDQWRSHWIDFLVREHILERTLLPHRHNPDDLVPVIKLRDDHNLRLPNQQMNLVDNDPSQWIGQSLEQLRESQPDIYQMATRIIVSIEQFTSFRNFAWCPLGSLHRRLRDFDSGMLFQNAVEYLLANDVVYVGEYSNPQSNYNTKGISLNKTHTYAVSILNLRNLLIQILLDLYESNTPVSKQSIQNKLPDNRVDLDLWISILLTENILNDLPGRDGQYSLFRTHHTVKIIAGDTNLE